MLSLETKESWSSIERLVFRFLFTYVVLYIVLLVLARLLETPTRWFAEYVLHWGGDFNASSTGSGDRTFDYVRLALNGFLTIVVASSWSLADKSRQSYNVLSYWFRAFLRVTLLLAMLLYGFVKVFKGQFPDHSLLRLIQPLGTMSPMGLAWTFLGHSFAYNIFMGLSEVLGGMLMLYRRTVTLGSLVIMGVMANVMMMNFTYDIPVKLFSTHLFLMAFVLFLYDRQRVINLFLRNQTIELCHEHVAAKAKFLNAVLPIAKGLLIVVAGLVVVGQFFIQFDIRDQLKTKSDLHGIWETELFVKNNDTIPPLLTDEERWRYLVIEMKDGLAVKSMTDSLMRYQYDDQFESLELVLSSKDEDFRSSFKYELDGDLLRLEGLHHSDSITMRLRKKPITDFLLVNRGFHWVNETPYNR